MHRDFTYYNLTRFAFLVGKQLYLKKVLDTNGTVTVLSTLAQALTARTVDFFSFIKR